MEMATTGVPRFQWELLVPVLTAQLEFVLRDYADEERVEIGPSRPLPHNESLEDCIKRLSAGLNSLQAAPFTIQRIAELLLEPRKHYSRLVKIASAFEKVIFVTTIIATKMESLPPPPLLTALPPVNCNPPPVLHDQRRAAEVFEGYVEHRSSTSNGALNGGEGGGCSSEQPISTIDSSQDRTVDLTSSLFSITNKPTSRDSIDGMDMS